MSPEFLLEIGTEELPSSFVRYALQSMETTAAKLLSEARLDPESLALHTLGTPRRLALRIEGLPEAQPERRERVVGPPWKAAFAEDGAPRKAAHGFARKHGVSVEALRRETTEKGDYVSLEVHESGRPVHELLGELLPELCARVAFPKSMRWGAGNIAFGRPIHWLLALLGNDVIHFEFAGLSAGRSTRGHRFLAPETIELPAASDYQTLLERANVVPDLERRRQRMIDALLEGASSIGGTLQEDAFLADECVSLVEAPFVVPGRFAEEYLALPDTVVVAVMRDHQRYFAVRDAEGALLPAYLNVANTAEDPETIAKGNDRVLRARLADARFFVEEDRKKPLASRLDKLDSVVFQRKLGSMGAKVRRIEALASWLAPRAGADPKPAAEAARLSKADLETLIVYEFPELQGEMGRWYALQEGIDPAVADAIREHYRPQGADDDVPSGTVGSIVAIADRIDTLVGCFAIGLAPTGSADPFALRRAALGIIRIALEGQLDVDLKELVLRAREAYEEQAPLPQDVDLASSLDEFFRHRVRAYAKSAHPPDVVDACLGAWDGRSIRDLRSRMEAVDEIRQLPEFEALAIAFKRAFNITKESGRGAVDSALLESGPEAELAATFGTVRDKIRRATDDRRYTEALKMVAQELGAPIDRFFDEVFVMVDDAKVRNNRLRLLGEIADTVNDIAHFHQLST